MLKIKLVLSFCLIGIFLSHSQCAMCRVVAESSRESGESIANGLNTGILYLMAFPYILMLIGLITLYVRKKNIINR